MGAPGSPHPLSDVVPIASTDRALCGAKVNATPRRNATTRTPLAEGAQRHLAAEPDGKPINWAAVEKHPGSKFGDALGSVRAAMVELAAFIPAAEPDRRRCGSTKPFVRCTPRHRCEASSLDG